MLNVAADGTTAVTGNPNATELQSQGNLLKAEGNWWGLRYNSQTNPGPAISPTTNPQVPENPVNGTATVETASGARPPTRSTSTRTGAARSRIRRTASTRC